LPDHLEIEVVIARRLTIGGEKAEAWFKINPISTAKAGIAEAAENQTRVLRFETHS
jgi:hypothetical protein